MAGQATQAAPAASAPAKSKSQLLDEIVSITEDTRVRLGARWGVPPSQVFAYGENFIALHRNCPEGFRVPPLLIAQFLQLAAEHDLNPARYEIRAFYDYTKGLQTFVMIDGWLTLANRQAQYDGYELTYERDTAGSLVACSALIYRKDRTRPTVARVKMTEWRDATKPQWQARPEWMLEQKAIKQGIRRAFGFAGIMDDDDAAKMGYDGEQAGDSKPVAPSAPPAPNLSDLIPAAPPPDDEYSSAAPRSVVSDVGEAGESAESEHTEESSPAPSGFDNSFAAALSIALTDANVDLVKASKAAGASVAEVRDWLDANALPSIEQVRQMADKCGLVEAELLRALDRSIPRLAAAGSGPSKRKLD